MAERYDLPLLVAANLLARLRAGPRELAERPAFDMSGSWDFGRQPTKGTPTFTCTVAPGSADFSAARSHTLAAREAHRPRTRRLDTPWVVPGAPVNTSVCPCQRCFSAPTAAPAFRAGVMRCEAAATVRHHPSAFVAIRAEDAFDSNALGN